MPTLSKASNFQKTPFSIVHYSPYKKDYCGNYCIDHVAVAGACEIQGQRPTQEDALVIDVDVAKAFSLLNKKQQKTALYSAFEILQNLCQEEKQGSTACFITGWQDAEAKIHTTTANLGDSTAFLVSIKKDDAEHQSLSERVSIERLNRLQKPDDPIDARRIWLNGGTIFRNRLEGHLNLAGAFGDNIYKHQGLLKTPEISQQTFNAENIEQAFIVLACDGLEERLFDNLNLIADCVNRYRHQDLAAMAQALVGLGYKYGSHDNISVAVMPVTTTPISAAVFDGHGGKLVSKLLANNFYSVLQQEMRGIEQKEAFERTYQKFKLLKARSEERLLQREGHLLKLTQALMSFSALSTEHVQFKTENLMKAYHPPMLSISFDDIQQVAKLREIAEHHGIRFIEWNSRQLEVFINSIDLPPVEVYEQFYQDLKTLYQSSDPNKKVENSCLQAQSLFKVVDEKQAPEPAKSIVSMKCS